MQRPVANGLNLSSPLVAILHVLARPDNNNLLLNIVVVDTIKCFDRRLKAIAQNSTYQWRLREKQSFIFLEVVLVKMDEAKPAGRCRELKYKLARVFASTEQGIER